MHGKGRLKPGTLLVGWLGFDHQASRTRLAALIYGFPGGTTAGDDNAPTAHRWHSDNRRNFPLHSARICDNDEVVAIVLPSELGPMKNLAVPLTTPASHELVRQ